MNVLVMAGTQDAVNIIKLLSKNAQNTIPGDFWVLATTTTDYGAQLAKKAGAQEVVSKPLHRDEMVDIINDREILLLIDATHPFAAEATRTAIYAAQKSGINYIRFERPSLNLEDTNIIHPVKSFDEAGERAFQISHQIPQISQNDKSVDSGRILHLAGVSTIPAVLNHIEKDRLFVRVLPTCFSIEKCLDLGIPGENILAMQGVFSKEFNKSLMKEYDISVIITKESGLTGGVPSKIDAARELNIDTVLVTRPEVPELEFMVVVNSLDELEKMLMQN